MKRNPLFDAAYKTIDAADRLISSPNSPFSAVYKQYKLLQSLWFRIIEEASDSKSRRLEDLSVDLENAIQRCKIWIDENSPNKKE